MQIRFEEAVIHSVIRLYKLVPSPRLVTAGGCALNGVANARILRDTPFSDIFIQPAASDDGTCLGAAYHCYYQVAGGEKRFAMGHSYWGSEYNDAALADAARNSSHQFCRLDDEALIRRVSQMLFDGKVVGWYQGRGEWGPRALGNRSILASPTIAGMKDTINAKVKRRESFRPFAPTVLREKATTYFGDGIVSPFMMHVAAVRREWQSRLPAVTHVDGTARLHTLERQVNPRFYDLIEAFGRLSGVDVLLNTSFNENEPIVDTPRQAMSCFERTDIDGLCLGNYLVTKPSLP